MLIGCSIPMSITQWSPYKEESSDPKADELVIPLNKVYKIFIVLYHISTFFVYNYGWYSNISLIRTPSVPTCSDK